MTYSLIGYDPETEQLGSLIASRWTAVGSCVPYFIQGVGLIHTQHCASPLLAHHSLTALQKSNTVETSLHDSLSHDSNKEFRQCIIADMSGNLAVFSGSKCEAICRDSLSTHVAAAGNMLASDEVISSMIDCFKAHPALPMAERLLRCLHRAEQAGGDRRGRESVSLRIFDPKYPQIKQFLPDLRVDNHENPHEELERLYQCYLEKDRSITPYDKQSNSI